MFAFFVGAALASTERASPTWWLNNWDSSNPLIGMWAAASDSWTVPPSHRPGLQNVRAFDDLSRDIITDDSFALIIDGKHYSDSMQLNSTHLGGCVFEKTGELWTEYTTYGKTAMPVVVKRSMFLPPHELFYEVKYTLKSTSSTKHTVKLLDYVGSAACDQWALGNCADGKCQIDQAQCGGYGIAVSVDTSKNVKYSMGNGDFSNADNVLKYFQANGASQNFPEYNQVKVSFGAVYEIEVGASEVTIVTYRAFGKTASAAQSVLSKALGKTAAQWESQTSTSTMEWINSGLVPSLSGDALDMYYKSLLVLKASQNPKTGTIASSNHYLYGYKNWMRDSIMAAFMLDAAGHHDDAMKFFDWIAYAKNTDNGAWHTCYSALTGEFVGFVEPQYDSVGIYLMAMNYHLKCYGDDSWVKSHLSTIEKMADWIVNNKGHNNMAISDRAPWEESTDHHTGEPIPEQYYAWSQGCNYGGCVAASLIEKHFGNTEKAEKYAARAAEIKKGVMDSLWDANLGMFVRGRWNDDAFAKDTRADSSSLSVIFTGLCDDMAKAKSHLNYMVNKLEKLGGGLSRYENDPYFFDSKWNPCGEGTRETQRNEPAWPVTTAYGCWSEDLLGIDYQKRLDWMVKYSCYGNMPIGEAVDSADGALIVPSTPDCFEHGGVYVFTTLLKAGKVKSIYDTLK